MKNSSLKILILLWAFSGAQQGLTDVRFLPKTKSDLPPETQEDEMVHVKGAKVSYLNRFALERDFPFLTGKSKEQMESWILDNFAYISSAQLRLDGIRQSKIPVSTEKKIGYRPPGWNRSAVVPFKNEKSSDQGLVDLKSVGLPEHKKDKIDEQVSKYLEANKTANQESIDALRTKGHSDGLGTHGEAIAEVTRAEALQKIFDENRKIHPEQKYETVEHYFVIRLPFDILKDGEKKDNAAIIGRQAHYGRIQEPKRIPDSLYIDPHGKKQFDLFGDAVDMGGVFPTAKDFQKSFLTESQKSKFEDGARDKKTFNPQESNAWKFAHDVGKAFDEGDSDAVYRHIREMVGPRVERTPLHRFAHLSDALAEGALRDPNPRVRFDAARDLELIMPTEQRTHIALAKALTDPEEQVRKNVASALMKIKPTDQESLKELAKLLKNTDQEIRNASADVLAELKPSDPKIHLAFAKAITTFHDDDLVHALSKLNPTDKETIHELMGLFEKNTDEGLLIFSNLKIADTKVYLEFVKVLKNPLRSNSSNRVTALRFLVEMRPTNQEIIDELAKLLEHSDGGVRSAAAQVLAAVRPSDPKIHLALANSIDEFEDNDWAFTALKAIRPTDQKTLISIAKLLKSPSKGLRETAAKLLMSLNSKDQSLHLEVLRGLLSNDANIRSEAADLIKKLGIHSEPTGLVTYLKSDCSQPMEKVINPTELKEIMTYLLEGDSKRGD
jgi:HEAT repeat protein